MAVRNYGTPGTYFGEDKNFSGNVDGVATSILGLIGLTEDVRGGAKVGVPELVTNWSQYLSYYAKPNSHGYTDFDAYLPHAASGFFDNGGGICYIMSIGTQLIKKSQSTLPHTSSVQILTDEELPSLNMSLRESQAANGAIQVVIGDSEPRSIDRETEGEASLNTGEYFWLELRRNGEVLEHHDHLSMNPDVSTQVATYVVEALESSEYVRVIDEAQSGQPLQCRPMNGEYELLLSSAITRQDKFYSGMMGDRDDQTGVRGFAEQDEITMFAFPDLMRLHKEGILNLNQVHGVMNTLIDQCTGTTDGGLSTHSKRMVILDTPHNCVKPQQVKHWLENEFNRRSMYTALYYPWVKVRNPRDNGRPILVPPSGHMAGLWARTDENRGVHVAPANIIPHGVIGLNYEVNNREQELLNPIGINCIRSFRNHGIRVWGARTLVTPDETEWRYISVRRLMNYIEKSIDDGIQWAVFEPNHPKLWGQIRRSIREFLTDLWRQGALKGEVRSEAFKIVCDETNNTPDSMALGRLYVEIQVAPVKPAEFIILNFQARDSMNDFE